MDIQARIEFSCIGFHSDHGQMSRPRVQRLGMHEGLVPTRGDHSNWMQYKCHHSLLQRSLCCKYSYGMALRRLHTCLG